MYSCTGLLLPHCTVNCLPSTAQPPSCGYQIYQSVMIDVMAMIAWRPENLLLNVIREKRKRKWKITDNFNNYFCASWQNYRINFSKIWAKKLLVFEPIVNLFFMDIQLDFTGSKILLRIKLIWPYLSWCVIANWPI